MAKNMMMQNQSRCLILTSQTFKSCPTVRKTKPCWKKLTFPMNLSRITTSNYASKIGWEIRWRRWSKNGRKNSTILQRSNRTPYSAQLMTTLFTILAQSTRYIVHRRFGKINLTLLIEFWFSLILAIGLIGASQSANHLKNDFNDLLL